LRIGVSPIKLQLMTRQILIFQKLHPLNFLLIFPARPFFRIVYWRSEGLPHSWLRRFEQMDPADHFTFDEWLDDESEAEQVWKRASARWNGRKSLEWSLSGLKVDLSRSWLQWLGNAWVEHFHFIRLASRWITRHSQSDRCLLAGPLFAFGAEDFDEPQREIRVARIFPWVDRCWQWTLGFLHGLHQTTILSRRGGGSKNRRPTYRYLWTGISPSEMANGPKQLNFAFLAERNLIRPDECLYLLPSSPSLATRKWLEQNGIHWASLDSCASLLPPTERIRVALGLGVTALKAIFRRRDRSATPVLLQLALRSQIWVSIGKRLKLEVHVSSISSCWPERPEVAVMNALKVRTINWSYGANAFAFSKRSPAIDDQSVLRSVPVAQEIWVWNEIIIELLKSRNALSENGRTTFWPTGPVMCGDARWLQKSPSEARRLCGLDDDDRCRYIAVFDVPPVSKQVRLKIAHGPTLYPLEMLEGFFEDVCALMDRFPGIRLLVKPKRSLQDSGREYATAMERLLDPAGPYRKAKRIILLDHNIDPYLPIGMADLCLGIPFTSPIFAGLGSGRTGIYHDPLGCVRSFRPRALEPLLTHGRQELMERLDGWLQGKCGEAEGLRAFESVLGPAGDPAEHFASLLKASTRRYGDQRTAN
jgi:hypothetical protein